MADSLVTQFNRELAAYLFRPFHDYDSIVVLLIHWEQSDDPGFKEETEKLKDFFEIELGYDVKVYPIPSQKSYWCLDYEFNTILRHLEPSTLLIVHYGGHGDPDNNKDKGQDRGSVWAARKSGGPTLNWSEIQRKFNHTESDILLILDCCYGAQAARNRDHLVPNKVELLTASAMEVKAAPPGPGSFTTAVIREMRGLFDKSGHVDIGELAGRLAKNEAGLTATPIHVCLKSEGRDRSIRLTRRAQSPITGVTRQEAKSAVRLDMVLKEELDPSMISKMVQYLRAGMPPEISSIEVREVFGKQGIRTLMEPDNMNKELISMLQHQRQFDKGFDRDDTHKLLLSSENDGTHYHLPIETYLADDSGSNMQRRQAELSRLPRKDQAISTYKSVIGSGTSLLQAGSNSVAGLTNGSSLPIESISEAACSLMEVEARNVDTDDALSIRSDNDKTPRG